MLTPNQFWSEFAGLFVLALIGGLAIMPYSIRLVKASKKPLKLPLRTLMLLSFLQTAVLSAAAIGLGLLAASNIGLGAPYIQAIVSGHGLPASAAPTLAFAAILGLAAGAFLTLADRLFLPYWPKQLLKTARETTLWENFTASFYGGINEEILIRLFGLSVVLWLLTKVWHTAGGLPTGSAFWTANLVLAVLFAVGHLPALKAVAGKPTPVMIFRALLLNMPIALLCGWLFWRYGLESAIIAHFAADIVYHVGGTIVLQRTGRL